VSEWIESHTSLPRHRKTKRLSRRLGISIRDTVGCLHMLWYYAADFAPSGNLDGHAPEDIASGCDWDGIHGSSSKRLPIRGGWRAPLRDWWYMTGTTTTGSTGSAKKPPNASATNVLVKVSHTRVTVMSP